MIKLVFPTHNFRIKEEDTKELIFDEFRKTWVRLTPEEWVRQNILQYLIQSMHYPVGLIGVEKEMRLGELKKRFDILVYDQQHQPWMMIECKAMEVDLSEKVLDQVIRYHQSIPVPFIVITNGSYTYAWEKMEGQFQSLDHFPAFPII
jgi:hypothetical protein